MRAYSYLIALSAGIAVVGCNESAITDYNHPGSFPHDQAYLQTEFSGVMDGGRTVVGNYAVFMNGMGRDLAYFTPSEDRFVKQVTGQNPIQNNNFIGTSVWTQIFTTVKGADTLESAIPSMTLANGSKYSAAEQAGLVGALETIKALDFMYAAETRDTLGVPLTNVGNAGANKPILCNPTVWKDIVAMLTTAKTSLDQAGGTAIPVNFPAGFLNTPTASGSTLTGTQFEELTLALRGKAEVEYAYAIARAGNGTPDATQLNAAIADIQASGIYSASLTPSEAVPEADAGAFHVFSTSAGDRVNPIFATVAIDWFLLDGALAQMDTTDLRFVAKFTDAGALSGTENSYTRSDKTPIASSWYYTDLNGSGPIAMVRNIELQFALAQAQLGLGQYAAAAATVDNVRQNVGGLPSGIPGTLDFPHVRDFLLAEQRVSLIGEGTGDRNIAMREYGLVKTAYTDWNDTQSPNADVQSSIIPLPITEVDARNGATTCVNQ